MHQKSVNGTFTSKIGFVLAAVGSAVGMGNIWMFPYRTGQYGGAAFLIPYLLFIALFGYVGLSGEFAFGRLTGTGPIGSYEYAMKTRGKKGGAILGAIPLFGSLGIAIGYSIIVGWVLRCAFGALTGTLISTEPEIFFAQMSATHLSSVPWHAIVVVMTVAILIFGVSGGIEKINKVMMPAFFILFLIIAVRVLFLPGALEGYKYLLVPQWEYLLNPHTWIMAMGQAFFSLSVTGSGMIIYGSYLSKKEDVVHSSCMTAVLDTCAAMASRSFRLYSHLDWTPPPVPNCCSSRCRACSSRCRWAVCLHSCSSYPCCLPVSLRWQTCWKRCLRPRKRASSSVARLPFWWPARQRSQSAC